MLKTEAYKRRRRVVEGVSERVHNADRKRHNCTCLMKHDVLSEVAWFEGSILPVRTGGGPWERGRKGTLSL